jgi:hypothetical protein
LEVLGQFPVEARRTLLGDLLTTLATQFIKRRISHMAVLERLSVGLNRPIELIFFVGENRGETSKAAFEAFKDCRIYAFDPNQYYIPRADQKIEETFVCVRSKGTK